MLNRIFPRSKNGMNLITTTKIEFIGNDNTKDIIELRCEVQYRVRDDWFVYPNTHSIEDGILYFREEDGTQVFIPLCNYKEVRISETKETEEVDFDESFGYFEKFYTTRKYNVERKKS